MAGFHKVTGSSAGVDRHPNDYYPTPPAVTRALLSVEDFPGPILEPCAGAGHIVRELKARGYSVYSNEPYPQGDFETDARLDWLDPSTYYGEDPVEIRGCPSIVTNPPYRLAQEFIELAIERGVQKHAWLLRFQFVESSRRFPLFHRYPPARLHVFSKRVQVSERGLTNPEGGMIAYAWWVWERGYRGRPELLWFPPDVCKENQ